MNKLIVGLALLLTLISGNSYAQTTIRGQVVDQEGKGIPLVTIDIRYRGHIEQRIQSDNNGYYSYTTKQNDKEGYLARFTHLAYIPQSVPLDLSQEAQQRVVLAVRSTELDEYVVTATRSRYKLEKLPLPVTIINPTDLKHIAPQNTKDVLLYSLPGVEFSAHGGITHISIQGLSADYFAFLIDGEEIAGLKSGSPDFLRLSPENIERVEIVRGAGSALYGSGAVGGVVNIITKQAKEPISLMLTGGYSMPNVWDGNVDFSIKRGGLSNNTAFSIGKEGDYKIINQKGDDGLWVPRNDVYRLSNRTIWNASNRLTLKSDINGMRRKQERNEYQNDVYGSLNGRITMDYLIDDQNSLTLSYNADYSARDIYYPKTDGLHDLLHSNFKHILRVHYNRTFSDNSSLATGIEGHQELLLSDQISKAKSQKKILNGVIYGQYLREIGKGFELMTGLRADIHGTYGLNVSPKLTLSYTWKQWNVRATYARAFKSPTIMNLYYDWSHQGMFHIYGNPDLKPEIANQLVLGTSYRSSRLVLSAGGGYTLFKDQIAMVADTHQDQRHINIKGVSRRVNADLTAEWFIVNGLSLKGMYSYTYAPRVKEHLGAKYDISTIRPHNILLQLNGYCQVKEWTFTASIIGQYLSSIGYYVMEDATKPLVLQTVEGYPLLRCSTTAEYNHRYSITIGANNLLNFKPNNLTFQTGTLTPGATVFARLGIKLF